MPFSVVSLFLGNRRYPTLDLKGGSMAKQKAPSFGGKKAAPFAGGGGRKQSHPNTAKGTPRKKASGKGKK